MTALDHAKFRKCLTLATRGATEGERQAGRAAAERVAMSAGLSIEEAERVVAQQPAAFLDALERDIAEAFEEAARQVRENAIRRAEMAEEARREANRERSRKAREQRRQEKAAAEVVRREMEEWPERAKAEQAERDRLWAEQRRARAAASGHRVYDQWRGDAQRLGG